ncbi:hypothetical protein MTR_3g086480 [Medicago truncatula]|nr:hypothetical protein MTR_3g086480 [Medicago truncatula]
MYAYQGSSSGYLILSEYKSFILLNPFTRRMMVINHSPFEVDIYGFACQVLLVFSRGSTEFDLVVLFKIYHNLHVYQSRNLDWVTYLTSHKVVDFVVLHNTIYVVTNKANIGILNLNSANIIFLEFKSTRSVTPAMSHVRLVRCDEYLLVLNIRSNAIFNVYKIDFSTMNYVKLKTLDDIALFYAPEKRYYALTNPHMWGYKNNNVYVIDLPSDKYIEYKGDDNKMPKLVLPIGYGTSPSKQPYLDWYFRHLHY